MRADWVDKNPKQRRLCWMAVRPDLVRQAGKQRGDGTNRLRVSVAQHISEKYCGTSQRQLRLRRRSRGEEQPVHYEVLVK